jgi:hypothetical protein
MHGTKNEPTWFSIQPPSPQDGTLRLENPLKSLLEHFLVENYFLFKRLSMPPITNEDPFAY